LRAAAGGKIGRGNTEKPPLSWGKEITDVKRTAPGQSRRFPQKKPALTKRYRI